MTLECHVSSCHSVKEIWGARRNASKTASRTTSCRHRQGDQHGGPGPLWLQQHRVIDNIGLTTMDRSCDPYATVTDTDFVFSDQKRYAPAIAMSVCCLILILLPLSCMGEDVRQTHLSNTADDVIFDECPINSMTARSKLDCARRCSSDPNCKTFTFTEGSPNGTCRLHPHVMTSQSPRSAAPGARSYTVKTEEVSCGVDADGWTVSLCRWLEALIEAISKAVAAHVSSELRAEMVTMRELLEKKDRQILHLQDRVDELEQYSRRNNIRISDIPEIDGEDTDDLIIAIDMYKQRLFKEKKKLANVDAKQLFPERSWRRRRTSQRPSYTTRAEPKIKIYLNDDLTKTRAEIASKARKTKSDGALQDTWVRDGTVRPIELRLHVS
ncbi:hypothetical protein BaRGS_00037809 [Batillaria attramentaria]|uniref:Apple domain-containing protein n=1 Tax=Batillaria attramentaria TaxID=370345 RepID=A0ABD0J7S1_9CAEN